MGGLNPQMAGGGIFADKDNHDLSVVTSSQIFNETYEGLQMLLASSQRRKEIKS